jgi:IPT/TIG domain
MVEADTIGSSEDTILQVVTGSAGAFMAVPGGCNDDINSGVVTASQVRFSATAGTTYYFMISNYEGSSSANSPGSLVQFNLNASTGPTLTQISPSTGLTGMALTSVMLTGTNFSSPLAINTPAGITATNTVLVNSTTVSTTLVIASNAALGPNSITVTTPGGTTAAVTLMVNQGPPMLTSISPASGGVGSAVNVTLTGTNFASGSAITFSGAGITVTNVVVAASDASITATFTIAANAALGAQTVNVMNSAGTTMSSVTFTVTAPPPPTLTAISSPGAILNSTLTVTLTGTNFITGSGNTTINAPAGITVSNVNVMSATSLTATFAIAANAPTGPQFITVTTAGGTSNNVMFGVGADFLLADNPTSGSVPPGSGAGTTVTITPMPANTTFPVSVQFMASGLPNETTCNFTSTAAGFVGGQTGTLPAADGAAASAPQVMLSCTTTAPSLVAPRTREPWGPTSAPRTMALAWASLLAALGAAFLAAMRQRRLWLRWALAAMLILAFAGLTSACGGGGGTTVVHNPGTTPGTYPITVMATSANASHTTTFTLTVQ